MKVIDKTPFQDEQGNTTLLKRFQGMLDYGAAWRSEVEAQKGIVAQLDRVLEKGYTLIRNLNLENSKIIEPLILIGPPGVFVLYVTPVTGFFEARGNEWNVIRNERRAPAQVNLMMRVARLARAVQVYLNRQGVYLPGMVEPVLIAASPGVHIDSVRPVVRIVLSDAVKQFAASLLQARPILRSEAIYEVVDHLLKPRPKGGAPQPGPEPAPEQQRAPEPMQVQSTVDVPAPAEEAPQRARAIFHAAEEAKPFDPADLSFEFDEHGTADMPEALLENGPSQAPGGAARRRGFTPAQWLVLILMLLVELAVLGSFVYLVLFVRP